MADWTPTYNPYGLTGPDGSDPIRNGDNRFRALIEDLSASQLLLDELPASPRDGQPVRFATAAMDAAGVAWRFVYSTAAGEWRFEGGPPLLSRSPSGASGITAGGSYAAAGDGHGPSITAPLAGAYVLGYGMTVDTDSVANSAAYMAPKVGAASVSDNDAARVIGGIPPGGSSSWGGTLSRHRDITVASDGASVTAHFKGAGGHVIWERWMTLLPVVIPG